MTPTLVSTSSSTGAQAGGTVDQYQRRNRACCPEPQTVGMAIQRTGARVRSEDRSLFPLTELIIMRDYGIGVLDRVGMALVSAGAGANYINPGVDR